MNRQGERVGRVSLSMKVGTGMHITRHHVATHISHVERRGAYILHAPPYTRIHSPLYTMYIILYVYMSTYTLWPSCVCVCVPLFTFVFAQLLKGWLEGGVTRPYTSTPREAPSVSLFLFLIFLFKPCWLSRYGYCWKWNWQFMIKFDLREMRHTRTCSVKLNNCLT